MHIHTYDFIIFGTEEEENQFEKRYNGTYINVQSQQNY
jgi:hypothetical protein